MINYLVEALKNKIARYSEKDQKTILEAFEVAEKAHSDQKRKSGEPYIIHPVSVACLLTDMKLDAASIITGLLHDTVEDTEMTYEDVKKMFGEEVAHLVEGVTKLSKLELSSNHSKQAENFRKLVIAMSDDIRVLLVKLVDRLHNMQTLYHVTSEKSRRRIAMETMEIYAPLAERIGMRNLQDDLQDLAFQSLYPQAYESIRLRLDTIEREGLAQIDRIVRKLRRTLKHTGVNARVHGRLKTPYSIWRKMKKKNISFEQISDVIAFRVIVHSVADCYQALGAIHNEYTVVPGTLKDYVSMPKPNHYQSIHTSVYFDSKRIEIQIRTDAMHRIAEYGVAAHWEYKQNVKLREGRQYKWLRSLLEILDSAHSPDEFLEHTKLEMFQDQVFCFTPQGDLITLPKGATCIDFAYAVHSDVGNQCTGVKVNGKMMPLRTELNNGDQVEIITSPNHEPSPTWERFVITGKARASIRRYIRTKQNAQFLNLGQAILRKAMGGSDNTVTLKDIRGHLSFFKCDNMDDLYAALGRGDLTAQEIINRAKGPVHPQAKPDFNDLHALAIPEKEDKRKKKQSGDAAIAIKGLIPGMAIHYAACCHPLPGDKIVGVVISGRGVTIHTLDCDNVQHYESQPERLLDVAWDMSETDIYVGRIFIILKNKPGALGILSNIIGGEDTNIVNLKITRRTHDFFDLYIDVNVQSVDHLNTLIATLRASSVVSFAERK